MKIWDGRRVETTHGIYGIVKGEATPGPMTGAPIITVVVTQAYSNFKIGDEIAYLTSDVKIIG